MKPSLTNILDFRSIKSTKFKILTSSCTRNNYDFNYSQSFIIKTSIIWKFSVVSRNEVNKFARSHVPLNKGLCWSKNSQSEFCTKHILTLTWKYSVFFVKPELKIKHWSKHFLFLNLMFFCNYSSQFSYKYKVFINLLFKNLDLMSALRWNPAEDEKRALENRIITPLCLFVQFTCPKNVNVYLFTCKSKFLAPNYHFPCACFLPCITDSFPLKK